MTNLTDLGVAEARDRLRDGSVGALELTEAALAAAEAASPLNAFCALVPERARADAEAAAARLAAGDAPDLCGVPIGVKDLFCVQGLPTQAASRILEGFRPPYESTVTAQLWRGGAVCLGKLNMDEFAMGSSNESSVFGPAVSPWRRKGDDRPLTPGGSSGGSAAAVAARICPGALGTDTGGSIRQPAAFTGIVGVKPTYGRCSRWGIVAFASSLDQAGPMARSVRDVAILLRAMAGHDPKDSTSSTIETPDFEAALTGDVRGRRIGVPKEYRVDGMPSEIEALWSRGAEMLSDAGAEVVEISLPHTRHAVPAYYVVAMAEASSNLARYDGVRYGRRARIGAQEGVTEMYERTRAEGFGPEVRRRVMIGTYVLSAGFYDAYYLRAQRVRNLVKRDFEVAFAAGVDAILTPTTPSAAFGIGEIGDTDPVAMYLNDVFTVTANLAGLPGVSVPAGLDQHGLPLGLQLIGRPWDEAGMLNVAYSLERASGIAAQPRKWW